MVRFTLVVLLFSNLYITDTVANPASQRFCVQQVSINIERVVSRIHISGEERKLPAIALLMPVDCQSGAYLKPDTLAQALRWLDLVLPIDYKSGLLKYNTYLHSPYGGSVDQDITTFLQDRWSLVKRNPLCIEAWSVMAEGGEEPYWDDEEVEYCGPELLDLLRKNLLTRHCAIPEGNKNWLIADSCG